MPTPLLLTLRASKSPSFSQQMAGEGSGSHQQVYRKSGLLSTEEEAPKTRRGLTGDQAWAEGPPNNQDTALSPLFHAPCYPIFQIQTAVLLLTKADVLLIRLCLSQRAVLAQDSVRAAQRAAIRSRGILGSMAPPKRKPSGPCPFLLHSTLFHG